MDLVDQLFSGAAAADLQADSDDSFVIADNDLNGVDNDEKEDDDIVILPNSSKAEGRKRRRTSSDGQEGINAMRSKVRQVERENRELKRERDYFRTRAQDLEPRLKLSRVHTHDVDVDVEEDFANYHAHFKVGGIENCVHIKQTTRNLGQYPLVYIEPSAIVVTHSVKVLADDGPRHVLSLVTVSQRSRFKQDTRHCHSTINMLMEGEMQRETKKEKFIPTDDLMNSRISIHFCVVEQKIDMPGDEGDEGMAHGTVTVVVEEKEFRVNTGFLSQWSRYFRAYFAADMEEKKTGIYPIKFEDISPEDFQEMLLVIYPTQKPISTDNYWTLLRLADRFEMPDLTRRIELFLIDFTKHNLQRAKVFRMACDKYHLPLVQATLLFRWRDKALLREELITHYIHKKLKPATRNMINQRFAEADVRCVGFHEKHSSNDEDDGSSIFSDDEDLV